jgi:hypothetical protein
MELCLGGAATKTLGMKTSAEAFFWYLKVLYFGDDSVTKEGVDKVNKLYTV